MRRFERCEKLLKDKYEKIKNLRVLVIGLGGVGGYTVESLARLGIKKIILVDFDKIEETNINRQIIALTDTIGKYKTDAWKKRIYEISPETEVEVICEKIEVSTVDTLFKDVDFIVDACDNTIVKCEIIKKCLEKKQKFITSMGTANKIDASKLMITTLDKTSYDPLAKILRKYMRDNNLKGKVPVVSSLESPVKQEYLGSISTVPSVAGLLITNYIVGEVLND